MIEPHPCFPFRWRMHTNAALVSRQVSDTIKGKLRKYKVAISCRACLCREACKFFPCWFHAFVSPTAAVQFHDHHSVQRDTYRSKETHLHACRSVSLLHTDKASPRLRTFCLRRFVTLRPSTRSVLFASFLSIIHLAELSMNPEKASRNPCNRILL